MTIVILDLPEPTLFQARQAALALKRPVEDVLTDMLTAILPSVADAPPHLQAELAQMTWLDNQDLWRIAHSEMTQQEQGRFSHIMQITEERTLTADEEQELETLRNEYGRVTLCKARAYALLSIRGGKPLLHRV